MEAICKKLNPLLAVMTDHIPISYKTGGTSLNDVINRTYFKTISNMQNELHRWFMILTGIVCSVFFACCSSNKPTAFDGEEIILAINLINEGVDEMDGFETKEQEGYDDAHLVWDKFCNLCVKGKFKKAYEYYKDNNYGEFMVYLKVSSYRYAFLTNILWPFMQEYESPSDALSEYVSLLKLEYSMEQMSMMMNSGEDYYTPEHYPALIMELGNALAMSGNDEEAIAMSEDLMHTLCMQTGNEVLSNFMTASYASGVLSIAGKNSLAIDVLETFKQYVENKAEEIENEEDIIRYMFLADKAISNLKNK